MSSTFVIRKLYYGEETSYGEAATMTDVFGLAKTFNAGCEQVREDIRLGDRVYYSRLPIGLNFSPSIEFYPLTGKFLKYVFGRVTNSGTSPPYTHTIEVGSSLKSLTVEAARIGDSRIAERVVGLLVNSGEISVNSDGILTASLDCKAKNVSLISPYTDPNIPPPAKRPLRFTDMVFSMNGVQYAIVTSARITINNNLEERPRASNGTVSGFTLKGTEYDAEVELLFEDFTFYDKFLKNNTVDIELKFSRDVDDYIKFSLNDSYLEIESELPFEGDVLTQTVRIYPKTITVEVKDDVASY